MPIVIAWNAKLFIPLICPAAYFDVNVRRAREAFSSQNRLVDKIVAKPEMRF
jgi:hypothetical protein